MKLPVIIRRELDTTFVARCLVLPGCKAAGRTEEQARDNIKTAIKGYLASINEFVPQRLEEAMEYQA